MARAEWLFSTENTTATSFMLGHEKKKSALTEGPTFPWGPASPGRPVRPCQRKSTVEIQMSHQTSPCRHVLNKGRNIWHCGKLGLRLWLAPCARSNSPTPADGNDWELKHEWWISLAWLVLKQEQPFVSLFEDKITNIVWWKPRISRSDNWEFLS